MDEDNIKIAIKLAKVNKNLEKMNTRLAKALNSTTSSEIDNAIDTITDCIDNLVKNTKYKELMDEDLYSDFVMGWCSWNNLLYEEGDE